MSEKVTEKSTKKQILSAYESALKEVKRLKSERLNPQEELRKVRKEEVDAATKPERLEDSLGVMKAFASSIPSAIRGFIDGVTEQLDQLRELDGAIAFRKKELDDLYGISSEAESLAALVESHKVLEAELDEEITSRRKLWSEEKLEHQKEAKRIENSLSEETARQKAEWEYNFAREVQRRKDELEDDLAARKKQYEEDLYLSDKELKERTEVLDRRQAELAEREAKVTDLEEQVERLKATREHEIEVAASAARDKAKASYNIELNAIKKSHEAEVTVLEGKNASLRDQVENLKAAEASLSAKLDEAYRKIQDVAVKSLESQGNSRMVELSRAMASDQPRQGKN